MSRLYFAGSTIAPTRFPERWELDELYRGPDDGTPLVPFVEAASEARRRFWVMDLHFEPFGFHGMNLALEFTSTVRDVRILSEPTKDKRARETALRAALSEGASKKPPDGRRGLPPARFEWRDWLPRKEAYPYAHDRFVILDDGLWHFGFAACGHGKCLSAASGPWPEAETGAVAFYERLWDDLRHA